MTSLQKLKVGARFIYAGLIFGLAETWYFGWNEKPESMAEIVCDAISASSIIFGNILLMTGLYQIIKWVKDKYNL